MESNPKTVGDPGFLAWRQPETGDLPIFGIIFAKNCMKMKKIGLNGRQVGNNFTIHIIQPYVCIPLKLGLRSRSSEGQ